MILRFVEPEHGCQILLSQKIRDMVEHKLPRDVNLHDLRNIHLKGWDIQLTSSNWT